MTRQEFERVVRGMQDEGVPLTMANLLVRTELPRAQIETWLDEMQRAPRFAPPPKPTAEAEPPPAEGVLGRAEALKRELMGEVLKARLGVGGERAMPGRPRREVKLGGVLGLLFPPLGLLYAAPWSTAVVGSLGYLVLAWLALKLALLGGLFGLLLPLHLVGGVLGAGYAWRFNRRGQRTPLLPGGRRE
jgi:hypothetical protein